MASASAVHIIDDDDAVRDSLAVLLELQDIPVATYRSGQEFLERTAASVEGCVVTDVQMPQLGGLEVLRAVKSRDRAVPVIVITARSGQAQGDQALGQGAAAYLQKPFEPNVFLAAVRAALPVR
jgi:two-component system response regulator FixJ